MFTCIEYAGFFPWLFSLGFFPCNGCDPNFTLYYLSFPASEQNSLSAKMEFHSMYCTTTKISVCLDWIVWSIIRRQLCNSPSPSHSNEAALCLVSAHLYLVSWQCPWLVPIVPHRTSDKLHLDVGTGEVRQYSEMELLGGLLLNQHWIAVTSL